MKSSQPELPRNSGPMLRHKDLHKNEGIHYRRFWPGRLDCDEVLSLDDFSTGRRDNLLDQPHLTQIEGSIVDAALIDQLFSDFKPDVVVHTAASYKDPED
jgi:hypothetical protein